MTYSNEKHIKTTDAIVIVASIRRVHELQFTVIHYSIPRE